MTMKDAFKLERIAAIMIDDPEIDLQPSKGIMFKSAAWIALNAGMSEESLEMVKKGLAGNPPQWIIDELLEIKKEVTKDDNDGAAE